HLACQSVLAGESDVAFAGGASVQWVPRHGHVHVPGHIYSEDGYCRAFDRRATGTVFGDGAGLVALKRLDLALADGDDILAVIRGTAVNNSGATAAGFTAPSYHAQKALLEQAYANADVNPAEVGLLEAHGTGTHLGDPIEFAALKDVFEQAGARPAQCALGALKANLGHLAAAAGIAGLIKVALCLRQGAIVPHPLFEASHPDIALDESPFYLNTKTEAWQSPAPRFAGVSSFGLGGSNAHAVLESAPPRPSTVSTATAATRHHVTLSAPTPDLLDVYRQDLLEHLTTFADVDPADVAFTLGQRAERFPSRLRLSFSGRDELLARLAAASSAAAAFTKPAGAEAHPDGTDTHPDGAEAHPDGAEPHLDTIGVDPDRIGAHTDGVGADPDRVKARPDRVGADPDRIGADPDRVGANPDGVGADPDGVRAHTEAVEAKPPAGRTVLLPVPRLRPTPASLAPIAADVRAPVPSPPAEAPPPAAPEASPRRPKVPPAASAMAAAPASPAPTLLKQIALMRLQLLALGRRGAA
ncbi:MAG TPA: beta-ketoacyl synthase N-terminal-like domain-containing protein, partial [Polyangiaceae bacterium]|nr:beta-ketoacyl synthase N-terminal-like domain-containing protein [Polyangiaceae bacterium]